MAKKLSGKKITVVREHARKVRASGKHPDGITIVDEHFRRQKGTYLDTAEIESIFENYDRRKIVYPTTGKLSERHKNADKYDDEIAVWTDYFNKKFSAKPYLDPDVVKALIDSESDFRIDPRKDGKAFGITQVTPRL